MKQELENKLAQNIANLQRLERDNAISKKDFQKRLDQLNASNAAEINRLQAEVANARQAARSGRSWGCSIM